MAERNPDTYHQCCTFCRSKHFELVQRCPSTVHHCLPRLTPNCQPETYSKACWKPSSQDGEKQQRKHCKKQDDENHFMGKKSEKLPLTADIALIRPSSRSTMQISSLRNGMDTNIN